MKTLIIACCAVFAVIGLGACSCDNDKRSTTYESASTDTKEMQDHHHHHHMDTQ